MSIGDLARFARTLSGLSASQLFWRGRYALSRRLPPPHIPLPLQLTSDSDVARDCETLGAIPVFHRPGPGAGEVVDRLAAGEFLHLNRSEKIGRDEPDWKLGPRSRDRLWAITLHYHAWCHALAEVIAQGRNDAPIAGQLLLHYVTDWIDRCDLDCPGARDLAWNSYAISTRIGWWVRSYVLLGRAWWQARPRFHATFLASLWRQAEFVAGHLEWDLRGNHLMRDAVGLAWAGRLFSGPRPDHWLEQAAAIAGAQFSEQVLPDGGHFERSPMYHLHVMEDVLSLTLLLRDDAVRRSARDTWSRMANYLAWMRHPDGDIPLLNDAALGSACNPRDMLAKGRQCGMTSDDASCRGGRLFADTGVAVWHGDPWTVFFDVGPVGPDCQPGHAHADTLTLECSLNGRRLFVDPGTYCYDLNAARRYDRSTAAHNTVSINNSDSSEVWHIFRVGARAQPAEVCVDFSNDAMTADAAHNGYSRLSGSPKHRRRVIVRDGGELRIEDIIDGRLTHTLEGGYLLAPEWRAEISGSGWNITDGDARLRVSISGPLDMSLSIDERRWHPQFGREIAVPRLSWCCKGRLPVEVTTVVDIAR